MDGLESGSSLADIAGLDTADIFEALAQGRDNKLDPDYWTFKIMQYLYSYMPFGKMGRWFVPVILGYGIYKSLEKLVDIVKMGWTSLSTSAWYTSLKSQFSWLPDKERIAFDGEITQGDATTLQAGLLGVLPPYAAVIVTNMVKNEPAAGNGQALAACQTRLAQCEAALREANGTIAAYESGNYSGSQLRSSAVVTNPYARQTQAPVAGAQDRPQWWEAPAGQALGGIIGGIFGGQSSGQALAQTGTDDWWSDRVVRDRVIRDANSANNMGMKKFKTSNY